jgi:hypothetical protein
VLAALVMERRKGQRKDRQYGKLYGIAFFRRLFFQFASGFGIYAAAYGINSGSDDVPGRSAVNADLVNLGCLS